MPKVNQEFLDQLAQEALDEIEFIERKNAIWKALGELYRTWAKYDPGDELIEEKLNDLMLLYDEWLD